MNQILFKQRLIRSLPGRLRVQIYGLKDNRAFAQKLEQSLQSLSHIQRVHTCTNTGRVLIMYNPAQATTGSICNLLHQLEKEEFMKCHVGCGEYDEQITDEVASTATVAANPPVDIPETFEAIPTEAKNNSVPSLALTASIAGLGIIGAKRLLMGKSQLAMGSGLFQTAGILSILTGYPVFKRGFERFSRERRLNEDLILGTAAFVLALVRENVIALAGVSLIQYLNWQQRKNNIENKDPSLYLSDKTKTYADRSTKLAFSLAGLTYLLTRNPLQTMGVMLAANPRPSLAAEEYAWKSAELNQSHTIPKNKTLCDIAHLENVVVKDTSLLFSKRKETLSCISNTEEDKIWCIAGSLVEKSSHHLKHSILEKATAINRTKRTSFEVKETEKGITGKVNGQTYCFGTKEFMQQHKILWNEFELEVKRWEKKNGDVYFLGKNGKCLAIFLYQNPVFSTQAGEDLKNLQKNHPQLRVYFLSDSMQVGTQLQEHNWELLNGEDLEKLKEKYIFVTDQVRETDVSCIPITDLKHFEKTLAFTKEIETVNEQHRQWTMVWNMLGTAFMMSGRMAAPLANLISDALKVVLLARAKKAAENGSDANRIKRNLQKNDGLNWHTFSLQQLEERLGTDSKKGLPEKNVTGIRSTVGLNQIDPAQKEHWVFPFIRQFKEFTTLILLGTSAVSLYSGDIFDGLAMLSVLLANAVVSTVQERKAEKVVDQLNQFQPPMCKVIREGTESEISAAQLVPGDIVVIESGDRVPADMRILSDWNLEVNESALTGESLAVKKSAGTLPPDTGLAERTNMLYMGTNITRGKGIGVVVETGMNTEIGYLTSLLKDENKEITPLQEKVSSISKVFVKGAFLAGALVLAVGLVRGNTIQQMIPTSVALIASAIPEGLPVTITIALSAGIYRMSRRNAVMRKLSALETLGRVSVICSDKTGTLTKNEMTVTKIATINNQWDVTGEGYSPEGKLLHKDGENVRDEEVNKILQIGALCNNSQLAMEEGRFNVKGDPTEGSLLTLAEKAGFTNLSHWHRKREIPFDSATGTMSVLCNDTLQEDACHIMAKGSVEAILKKCSFFQQSGKVYPLTEDIRTNILQQNDQFAAEALRVLGFAYRVLDTNETHENAEDEQLIYVGMVGMIDPPKSEVAHAIAETFRLGVKPVMITGDHPITAIAIGSQLGLYKQGDRVLIGSELDELCDEQLENIVGDVSIFARVTPEHKLSIVQAYQKTGQIVAMTGDGVNDAPAIKKANVGIAMGRTGTEVTKQTADMVLKEDHFGSILEGVKEGRTIISNIRKAIGCLLTGNLAEILVSSLAVIGGMPIPLVPVQILLMNLLTDALPAAVLAVNPGNKELVTEKQDIVDKSLYKKVAIRGIVLGLGSLGLFATSLARGASLPAARTMAFATLVAGQLIQTFSWRQENGQPFSSWIKEKFFVGSLAISWISLFSVLYVPALARVFHTAPLQWGQLLQVLLVSGSVSLLSKPLYKALTEGRLPSKPVLQAA